MHFNRRNFITKASIAALSLTALSAFKNKTAKANKKDSVFIHHVFFWLANPDSIEDKAKLIEGLTKLSAVKTIKNFHIGKPANTSRDVIDSSYSISWMLNFANDADQASYQTDPIHLNFVEQCKHLWKKVVVYDSVDI
jgi:Stress responsive A/B Barrel Domain